MATLSADEIRQIFEIRFALEALALRQSVPKLDASAFEEARKILDALDSESDIGRWVELHRKFHMRLYSAASARLLSLIEDQYDAVDRYLRLELLAMDNAADNRDEHHAILDACMAGDIDTAIRMCEPHIAGAGSDLAEALDRRRRAGE